MTSKYWRKKPSPIICNAYRNTNKYHHLLKRHNTSKNYFDYVVSIPVSIPQYSENPIISKNILRDIIEKFPSHIQIYTDASKGPTGTGCAFLNASNGRSDQFKLPNETTIFSAEAFAVLQSLLYAETNIIKSIIICTDSLSVVTAIKCYDHIKHVTNAIVLDIILKLGQLKKQGYSIYIVWVKAHIGLIYNEKADELAKESCNLEYLHMDELCEGDVIAIMRTNLKRRYEERWNSFMRHSSTRYSLIQTKLPIKLWFSEFSVHRRYVSIINRLRFGHGSYPTHLTKINIIASDICQHCGVDVGDLDHILFACSKHKIDCQILYDNIASTGVQTPLNLLHCLSLNKKEIIYHIINFFKTTGIVI